MKVGDYVRTKYGEITKIKDIWENERIFFENIIVLGYTTSDNIYASQKEKYIIKSSPNIIDLIEVGDYINGFKVYEIKNGQLRTISYYDGYICYLCSDYEIKSIVTKQQFKNMEYKVGDNNE